MSQPIRIWASAAHHPAFGCGGWAWVRLAHGRLSGLAGGERRTSARRMALAGLAAALRDLPPAQDGGLVAAIEIRTTCPELEALAAALAGRPSPTGGAQPELDLEIEILAGAKHRLVSLTHAPAEPSAPTAFTAAWAELAMDKAKAGGAFTSAIPKSNLAKIQGLGAG